MTTGHETVVFLCLVAVEMGVGLVQVLWKCCGRKRKTVVKRLVT